MLDVRLVRETAGLLFVYKPAGLTFHSSPDEVGLMPHVRELYPDQPLFPCHRLDRMTSGLLMVAKSHEAAAAMAELLRERRIVKYYVALSAKKPKKKMGRVMGDMARSRRGQWMLCRTMSNPAITHFISEPLCDDYRAFVLKPATGQTHQLRVALKSLGSPVLGDPRYAASGAALEDRGYLHAAALRLPPGWPALTDGGRACNVARRSRGPGLATTLFRAGGQRRSLPKRSGVSKRHQTTTLGAYHRYSALPKGGSAVCSAVSGLRGALLRAGFKICIRMIQGGRST